MADDLRPYRDPKWLYDQPISLKSAQEQLYALENIRIDPNAGAEAASVAIRDPRARFSVADSWRSFASMLALQYSSVFIAQPFEVAKTILQCQYIPRAELKFGLNGPMSLNSIEDSEDSDLEMNSEQDFSGTMSIPDAVEKLPVDRNGYIQTTHMEENENWRLAQKNSSIKATLTALRQKEGILGLWKGQTISFVLSILSASMEPWLLSFYSAIFAAPDPSIYDIYESPQPFMSLTLALLASLTTALVLTPLDILKVKTILSPRKDKPTKPLLSYPTSLVLPTILYSTVPRGLTSALPLLLKSVGLTLDPLENPFSYHLSTFAIAVLQLTIRLPVETILRTAQLSSVKLDRTIVPTRKYTGIAGTVWQILNNEENASNGLDSFYRGWKVGLWGIVGVWSLETLGSIPQDDLEL